VEHKLLFNECPSLLTVPRDTQGNAWTLSCCHYETYLFACSLFKTYVLQSSLNARWSKLRS